MGAFGPLLSSSIQKYTLRQLFGHLKLQNSSIIKKIQDGRHSPAMGEGHHQEQPRGRTGGQETEDGPEWRGGLYVIQYIIVIVPDPVITAQCLSYSTVTCMYVPGIAIIAKYNPLYYPITLHHLMPLKEVNQAK